MAKKDAVRIRRRQERDKKRAAKEARMKNPSGGSKYAQKVKSGRVYQHDGQSTDSSHTPPVRSSFGRSSTSDVYRYGYRHPSAPSLSSSWRSSRRRSEDDLPVLRNGEEVYPARRDDRDERPQRDQLDFDRW